MAHRSHKRLLTAALVFSALLLFGTSTAAQAAPKVSAAYGVMGNRSFYASGRSVGSSSGALTAVLEFRSGKKTKVVARRKIQGGAFQLKWRVPKARKSVQVRVRFRKARGKQRIVATGTWRRLSLTGLKSAPSLASLPTSKITSAPAPGTPGVIEVSGATNAKAGQIVALGITNVTPDGLLAQITNVTSDGGTTKLETVPATLPEAIPVGSFDIRQSTGTNFGTAATRSTATTRSAGEYECEAGNKLHIDQEFKLHPDLAFSSDWKWGLPPRVTAQFEMSLGAEYKLDFLLGDKASCTITDQPLSPSVVLARNTFSIGPVPVVFVTTGQLFLQAEASVQSGIKADVSGTVTGSAGVQYDKGFKPIGGISTAFKGTAPQVSVGSTVEASLAPAIDVKLYGVTGPRVDFRGGLKFESDLLDNPWWTLKAPVDVGAELRFDVWKFHVDSPRLSVWSHEYDLARASGGAPGMESACAETSILYKPSKGPALIIQDLRVKNIGCDDAAKVGGQYIETRKNRDGWSCSDDSSGLTTCTRNDQKLSFRFGGDAG